jgi:hypothetical protein
VPLIYNFDIVVPSGKTALACSLAIPFSNAHLYVSKQLLFMAFCLSSHSLCNDSSSISTLFWRFFLSCILASLFWNPKSATAYH